MSVTLTGYRGGANALGASQVGIAGLQDAIKNDQSKVKANEILASLRNDLRTKTGVLRLLHTSDADKDMKFQNSGGFKQIFLSGAKLQRSGEVVSDLLKAAGLSDEKVQEFNQYVTERGHSGVKAKKVLEFIDSIKVQTSDTEDNAVKNLGIRVDSDTLLGGGASGVVKAATYRGNDYVFKQPKGNNPNLGFLFLANEQGKIIYPKSIVSSAPEISPPAEEQQRYSQESIVRNSDIPGPKKLVMIDKRQATEERPYIAPKERQNSSISSLIESDYRYDNNTKNFVNLFRQIPGLFGPNSDLLDSDDFDEESSKDSVLSGPIGRNDDQVVVSGLSKPDVQFPIEEDAVSSAKTDELSAFQKKIDLPAEQPVVANAPSKPQLAREGIANAARVKNLPQVITPTVYVLRETPKQGPAQYHAIEGSVALKAWATKQSLESTFEVTGLLMPKATGNQPLEYTSNTVSAINVDIADLKPMAESGLSLLKGLAAHGFIHGDIKPENLMWDSHTKNLQLIDNDSLQKISKNSKESGPNDAHTLIYLNPVAWKHKPPGTEAKLGIGRDLFALGMVILETSLYAKDQGGKADQLMERLTFGKQPTGRARYFMASDKYQEGIQELQDEKFDANSIEAFARSCIIESIRLEETRLAGNITAFERYNESQPDAQHLLAKLERDLAQIK